jgi:mannose-6-phosphate isomerase-like protein (cupin superfamily)
MIENSEQTDDTQPSKTAVFDLHAIAARFPASADTMLIDTRLTDEKDASARVFRVYRTVAAHFHATCDEYLMVLSGRATFFIGDEIFDVGPGQLMFFKKNTVHGTSALLEEPFVVFAVDTPRRDPSDVTFVQAEDGTPDTFIQSRKLY